MSNDLPKEVPATPPATAAMEPSHSPAVPMVKSIELDRLARKKLAVTQRDEMVQVVMQNLQACTDPKVAATLLRLGQQILRDRDAALAELESAEAAEAKEPPTTPETKPHRAPRPKPAPGPWPTLEAALQAPPPGSTAELSCFGAPHRPLVRHRPENLSGIVMPHAGESR